jgi:hypothetical protein
MKRPQMSKPGIYDPTEMFNREEMRRDTIESSIKLGFYMLTFFYYLYRFVHCGAVGRTRLPFPWHDVAHVDAG